MNKENEISGPLYDVLSRPLAWDPVAFTVPKPREERKVTSHYASSLVGCVREAYYKWVGAHVTDPTSRISRMKMEAGEDAAQWFGQGLVRRAPEWGYEAKILDAEVVIEIFPPGLLNPIHGRLDYLVEISGKCGRQVLAIEYKSLFGYGSDNVIGKSRWTGTPDELALYEELEAKGMEEPLSEREQKILESLEKYNEWSPGSPMDRPSYLTQIWAYMRSGIQADHWLLVCQDRGSKVDQTYEVREVNDCLYWAYVPKGLPGQYGERLRNGGWKKAPFTWEQVVGRLAMIEEAVAKREPPDRICPVMGERYMAVVKGNKIAPKPKMRDQKPGEVWWKCSGYCEYAKLCWLGLGEGNE